MKTNMLEINFEFEEREFIFHFTLPEKARMRIFKEYFYSSCHAYFLTLYRRTVERFLQNGMLLLNQNTYVAYSDWALSSIDQSFSLLRYFDDLSNILLKEILNCFDWLETKKIRIIDFNSIKVFAEATFGIILREMNIQQKYSKTNIMPLGINIYQILAWKWIAYAYRNYNPDSNLYKSKLKVLVHERSTHNTWVQFHRYEESNFSNFSMQGYNEYKSSQRKILNNFINIVGFIPSKEDMRFIHKYYPIILKEFLNNNIKVGIFEEILQLENPDWFVDNEGSWFEALVNSSCLENAKRKTKFGTWVIAEDGHTCKSIAEKNVDDWLFRNHILHEKEVKYPNSRYIADWKVRDFYIELFGLKGEKAYDNKIRDKRRVAKLENMKMIELYLDDILTLENKLEELKGS